MKPRIHQNGSHKERKKGILNVCQLLLLTNTFSDFFLYLFAVLIKICSFCDILLIVSWFGLFVVSSSVL